MTATRINWLFTGQLWVKICGRDGRWKVIEITDDEREELLRINGPMPAWLEALR